MRLIVYITALLPIFAIANDNEALFLRRIAEFWEEGEYKIAKSQMEEFIASYPESPYSDQLSAALGDLFFREKNFTSAVNYYAQIKSDEFKEKIFLNRMHSLYELQWHATIVDECEAHLSKNPDQIFPTYFLSLALYQQCLMADKDPKIAARALPYFEKLYKSELSSEAASGLAHIYCILKDFEKGAQIYLDLALKNVDQAEEMLFQAALLQSEYDKSVAIETFGKVASLGQSRSKESAYNQMVLKFEIGRYDEISIPTDLPEDRLPMAHLFLGRSYLALKKYPEAISELRSFIQTAERSATCRAAILCLLDAANCAVDLDAYDAATDKLKEFYPEDAELPKMLLWRALLSEYLSKAFDTCRTKSLEFISKYPQHPLTPKAWKYFAAASAEVKNTEQYITDLKLLISQDFLEPAEKKKWEFQLAKAYFDLGFLEKSAALIQPPEDPNAKMLLALCSKKDFCSLAEEALLEGADLIPQQQVHLSLFNAYLEKPDLEKAAGHLFAAFEAGSAINEQNLTWLSDYYFERDPKKSAAVLKHLPETASRVCKLARILKSLDQTEEMVVLLEKNTFGDKEAELLLAEGYVRLGQVEKAEPLFDAIVAASSSMRSFVSASASLQSIRLKLAKQSDLDALAVRLKDLILQKNLKNEPIHLEAALEYVNLLGKTPPKRLELLLKIKSDFEKNDDLLSKDYHEARVKLPEKDQIYLRYMQMIDAEIARIQNET